jgi:hypothetical protein
MVFPYSRALLEGADSPSVTLHLPLFSSFDRFHTARLTVVYFFADMPAVRPSAAGLAQGFRQRLSAQERR